MTNQRQDLDLHRYRKEIRLPGGLILNKGSAPHGSAIDREALGLLAGSSLSAGSTQHFSSLAFLSHLN